MTMDINTIVAFLMALILIILVTCIDDGIPLIIIGFLIMAFAWNLTSIFGFASTDLAGWGKVIILGYWIIATFAFLKSIVTGYDQGAFSFRKWSKHE